MDIQWPLVLFTVFAGSGAWLLVFTALNEFTGRAKNTKMRNVALIVAFVLAAVGGVCSIFHLSHPERMMGALSHPTSGIFTEALMIGLVCLAIIVYFMMIRREASEKAIKGSAAAGLILGLILSFAVGESYMMAARPSWDTILLPIGYMGTASVVGASLYLLLLGLFKDTDESIALAGVCTIATACFAAAAGSAFGIQAGAMGSAPELLWLGVLVCGAVVPACCAFIVLKKSSGAHVLGAAAVVFALVGCVAFRCMMWVVGTGIVDYMATSRLFGL